MSNCRAMVLSLGGGLSRCFSRIEDGDEGLV